MTSGLFNPCFSVSNSSMLCQLAPAVSATAITSSQPIGITDSFEACQYPEIERITCRSDSLSGTSHLSACWTYDEKWKFMRETGALYEKAVRSSREDLVYYPTVRHLLEENALYVRQHLKDIEEVAALIPDEKVRDDVFTWAFPWVIDIVRRHGFELLRKVVQANPQYAQHNLRWLRDLSELGKRIGLDPFIQIMQCYENAYEIFGAIRGTGVSGRDKDGNEKTEYWHSMENYIRSAEELMVYAERIHEFLLYTENIKMPHCCSPSGYLSNKYGVENLAYLGKMAKAMGDEAFTWTHNKNDWISDKRVLELENVVEAIRPFIDRMGMGFVADAFLLLGGHMEALIEEIELVREIYPRKADIITMLEVLTATLKRFEETGTSEERRLHLTRGWLKWGRGIAIKGFFGIPENRELVQTYGVSAVGQMLAGLEQPPAEKFFSALAVSSHLVNSVEDLCRIGRTIEELNPITRNLLPSLSTLIDSEEDIGSLDEIIKQDLLSIEGNWHQGRRAVVLKLLPHLLHIVTSHETLTEVLRRLGNESEGILNLLGALTHLIDSPDRIPSVSRLLDQSVLWLFYSVKQDIHSMDDLREFASLSCAVQDRLLVSKDSSEVSSEKKKEVAALLTSREKMKMWIANHKGGFVPTGYLIEQLAAAKDRRAAVETWRSLLASFSKGGFDPDNELHRNLEYTRFRRIVDHEKVRRHIKNHFTFEQYEAIFQRPGNPALKELSVEDRFEIACAAHESYLLNDFIRKVVGRAKELGREVIVVPNLSYGYVPVAPLMEGVEKEGVEVAIGVKVGSSDCHENKEVINSRLFKGYRRRLAQNQPIVIVIDGTKHLVSRDGDGKDARYPDAYQGYLNQVIAMNDALGFHDVDYSRNGKNPSDLERLRTTPEFQRLVRVFRELLASQEDKPQKPYTFQLWNTAGMDLIIRGEREELTRARPLDPSEIGWPAVIFCNVGLLDEQIPGSIKGRYPGQKHTPAYFDDSGRIIAFDFGYDNFGVKYLNRLEIELKRAYGHEADAIPSVSGFITRLRRAISVFTGRSVEPYESPAILHAGI